MPLSIVAIKIKSLRKQTIVFHDALLGGFKKRGLWGNYFKMPYPLMSF